MQSDTNDIKGHCRLSFHGLGYLAEVATLYKVGSFSRHTTDATAYLSILVCRVRGSALPFLLFFYVLFVLRCAVSSIRLAWISKKKGEVFYGLSLKNQLHNLQLAKHVTRHWRNPLVQRARLSTTSNASIKRSICSFLSRPSGTRSLKMKIVVSQPLPANQSIYSQWLLVKD